MMEKKTAEKDLCQDFAKIKWAGLVLEACHSPILVFQALVIWRGKFQGKTPVLLWKSANFLILQCGRRENGRIGGHRLGKWPRRVEIYQHTL